VEAVTSAVMQQPLAYIPSPSDGVWHLGFIPIRGYALSIILGVIVAVWLGERRWTQRGGAPGTIVDIAVWAVPFGLVGGRLYHVITDYQLYFGEDKQPVDALKIWNGGLGIWGAISVGALGAYIGARRRGVSLRTVADATAPGIALAQAIGRWGNWFNQELYGRPLDAPWAVRIDFDHRPKDSLGNVLDQYRDVSTYHPTFLYESLWCIALAIFVIWAEKRFRLGFGRTFALYVAGYTVGRAWIEALRIDTAHEILGLRLNDWTAIIVFLGAVAYLYINRGKQDETPVSGADSSAGPAAEEATPDEASTAESASGEDAAAADETRADPTSSDSSAEAEPEPVTADETADEEAEPEPVTADETADEEAEPEPEPATADEEAEPEPATAGKPAKDAGEGSGKDSE
jgi:prolipoprotein diacylglyceryl transferase